MELQGRVNLRVSGKPGEGRVTGRILETSHGRKDGRMYFINSPVHKIVARNQ